MTSIATFENRAKIRVPSYETPLFFISTSNYKWRCPNNQLFVTSIGPVLDFETVKFRVDKQRATEVIFSITLSIIGLLATGKA